MTDHDAEWLETDGLGGFASGSADTVRRRRYHALLIAALDPPGDRRALVKGIELWLSGPGGVIPLSSQCYRGDVVHPDSRERLASFRHEPWPNWRWTATNTLCIDQELCMVHGHALTLLRFRAHGDARGYRLHARLLLSGCDFHALEREDDAASLAPSVEAGLLCFALRDARAGLAIASNARYRHAPDWYRGFLYGEERARGFDCEEDLASPGELSWDLDAGEALLALFLDRPETRALLAGQPAAISRLFEREQVRRAQFSSPLARAADAYVVRRGTGATVIAGYPWFGDWGRDTFIALRGLGLASGHLELVRDVLLSWAPLLSDGMLPNRFDDGGGQPEYNTVDAALWYVLLAGELLARGRTLLSASERGTLTRTTLSIVAACLHGTRHGIHVDVDGLLACGAPGLQLTWMDAKVGDWVVTPRAGKPVEIQALWIAALRVAAELDAELAPFVVLARESFAARFWCEEQGHLYDVIDVAGEPDVHDASLRPNQLFALGTLGTLLISRERAERVLAAVEHALLTPLGLRSLAPTDAHYRGHYEGDPATRDARYHQGTVWPFLLGAYVDAVLSVRGDDAATVAALRAEVLAPIHAHLAHAGLGHVSEIADGDAPHAPRGCPFQAWSLAELLRVTVRLDALSATRSEAA